MLKYSYTKQSLDPVCLVIDKTKTKMLGVGVQN